MLDEPTASLPQDEVEVLFAVLRALKASGVGMIYVSHRLDEIFAISDRMVVLRDGQLVGTRGPPATPIPIDLVRDIIGRPPEKVFMRPADPPGTGTFVARRRPIDGESARSRSTLHGARSSAWSACAARARKRSAGR